MWTLATAAAWRSAQPASSAPHPAGHGTQAYGLPGFETEVNSEGLAEFGDERWGQSADPPACPFDCHRADLFRLRFRVARQAGLAGGEADWASLLVTWMYCGLHLQV